MQHIQEGENLPGYLSPVKVRKGIEVGHIFQLGDKYSKALNAAFQNRMVKIKIRSWDVMESV